MILEKQKAPLFTLKDSEGNNVSLSDFFGKKVVVYFYPKDHTPGCTRQACAFRNAFDGFKDLDVVVIGISRDSEKSHAKFIQDYQLPFILLADPNLEAIKSFGVWVEKKMYGKTTMGVSRSTFVINENGVIEKVFAKANPDTNAQDVLNYLNTQS
ncbi:MAG TPA: thioredoxin-dependent thiol peroxidase [Bacilli bacterium]|nr:MAG: putative peroxiredoxin bcp [Tenericutes bacterium ADurb.BinA124]HNZ51015.1 thioredoxin-dependent thiol peroxidase [Bacilli bacterium]HPX84897.1 thioredoxin-dependent thiol peroxidase [Bacilli bacterium]HQC74558.1 thioredoxin-dependent thiol peroxidase [Bacilli bacterium]